MPEKRSIGEIIIDAILRGATNEQAIWEVLKVHPSANTSEKSITWYRNRLKAAGAETPSARQAPGIDKGFKPPKPKPYSDRSDLQKARGIACEVMIENGTNEQAFRKACEKFPEVEMRKREVSDLRHILVHMPEKDVLTDAQARKLQSDQKPGAGEYPVQALSDEEKQRRRALLEELREILAI
jgi:hypothetical protein